MLLQHAAPTIVGCRFTGNMATVGEALAVVSGGGEAAAINCTFAGNRAEVGAAVVVVSGRVARVNCLITGNAATGSDTWYARIVEGAPGYLVRLANRTVIGNEVGAELGAALLGGVDAIVNCIVWGNQGPPISSAGAVTYSCVTGDDAGEGDTDAAPLFYDPARGDDRLTHGSPCLDAGSDDAIEPDRADLDGDGFVHEPTPLDLDGRERILGAGVDMGAYKGCRHDLDADGGVTVTDFLALLAPWRPAHGDPADFDRRGTSG
jgi:hypothetical protein